MGMLSCPSVPTSFTTDHGDSDDVASHRVAASAEREFAWARAEAEAASVAEVCRLHAEVERSSRIEGNITATGPDSTLTLGSMSPALRQ
eukprot:COSAG02_NODE_52340_length_308_cov_0.980861_1_plen_88_part_10